MFVAEEGNVWVCGSNNRGELGVGKQSTRICKAERNKKISGIVAGSGGYWSSVFLDNEGRFSLVETMCMGSWD